MSLRLKLVAALVLLSAAATVLIGATSYASTRDRLHAEVDRSLDDAANFFTERHQRFGRPPPGGGFIGARGGDRPQSFQQALVQSLDGNGAVAGADLNGVLPVDDLDRKAASSVDPLIVRRTVEVHGTQYRMFTASYADASGAVQVARSLAETNRLLATLRNRAIVAVVLVVFFAGLLGWLIARQVTRRLVRLTATAETVAATGRLDLEVPVAGHDEAGRLGVAFNEMLAALARSKDAQQRLVQDAGHELRTPLTSLRTNVSVMRRYGSLSADQRQRLLEDLDGETRELTDLVNELVELATDRRGDEPIEEVALGRLVEHAAARTRRRSGREIVVDADGSERSVRPQAVERAIGNLLDNAAKFDESKGPIEVRLRAGRVEVCDRGPGIAATDEPHVFDRFYRAIDARSSPGSGLGLAIVRDIVESHGGTVFAADRDGGGACVGFELPAAPGI